MRVILAAVALAASALLAASPLVAAPRAADLVQAELLVERDAIRAGQPFTVGVRLTMKAGWHTYWRNPGDSGLATEIRWTLPPGFSAGAIEWPAPSRIPVAHLVNYGYEHDVLLLTTVTPPADLPAGRSLRVQGQVSYLVCERECIPGEADVSASLDVAAPGAAIGPGENGSAIAAARASLPQPSPWPARIEPDGSDLKLVVDAPGLKPEAVRSALFFPESETAIEHAAAQPLTIEAGTLMLKLTRSALASGPIPTSLAGVLVIEEALGGAATARQAVQIGSLAGGSGLVTTALPGPDLSLASVLSAALFAFLGGLLLNLMPCVFPVLSIKVMSLVRHSGQAPAAVRLAGFAYAAGVLACFMLLAGVLLAVRAGGAELGWGFQLQSPPVVAGLAFLMLALGLSLSGVVEFGASLARFGGAGSGSGPTGSFLTGFLAAIVATPCTAPFMGAAIGYGLTAPPSVALAIFAALGLGMAAPFLLLVLRPGLVARLPRPGAWMETLKQVLAFPVYATVAWLVFVLSQQVGPTGLFAVLLGLVLAAFGLWSLRFAASHGTWARRLGHGLAAAALVGLVAIGWTLERGDTATSSRTVSAGGSIEAFSQTRLDALRAEGRPVFVNMTAAWCITCLVNERVALSGAAVKAALESRSIAYLKGDWTNQNPEITRLLEQHGRSGVPLYLLYPARGDAIILPQILTEAGVLASIEALGPAGTRRADLTLNPQETTR